MDCSRLNKIFCFCTWKYSTTEKVVITPELVQPIHQGCPLSLNNIPLEQVLTEIRDPFQ